ncbi:Hypothetical predicted protein [Marmota monax]|uniref:Uncharacterized protein n=1 Tax=Marmota monax TaxID=9995 RepID=A0A5E4BCI8_MARMO|nr:hypothetical protein GHT09_015605 [Marmota monax]VTJ67363.1 Hypothetical predicted protein [Marmota monax]
MAAEVHRERCGGRRKARHQGGTCEPTPVSSAGRSLTVTANTSHPLDLHKVLHPGGVVLTVHENPTTRDLQIHRILDLEKASMQEMMVSNFYYVKTHT